MKAPDKLDMVPETLRKEISDFVSKNATFLFGAANNFDEGTTELYNSYGKMAKMYRESADKYQKLFLDLILADELDKAAVAKLIQELFRLIAEQDRTFEECRQTLFKEYRAMGSALTLYLALVSGGGVDLKEAME